MHIEGENPLTVGARLLDDGRPEAVAAALQQRVGELRAAGITGPLFVDPGLSINYRSDYAEYGRHQLAVIRALDVLRVTGEPVLIPVPRKAIHHRMLAYLTVSIEYGADVIRVHDVEAACDLVTLLGRRLGGMVERS
jgi:dihydropteroate synthase